MERVGTAHAYRGQMPETNACEANHTYACPPPPTAALACLIQRLADLAAAQQVAHRQVAQDGRQGQVQQVAPLAALLHGADRLLPAAAAVAAQAGGAAQRVALRSFRSRAASGPALPRLLAAG